MPTVAMAEEMAEQGQIVLAMEPRISKMKNEEGPYTGDWATDLQANLIGENLPALRAHDILRGIDLLQYSSRTSIPHRFVESLVVCRGFGFFWLLRLIPGFAQSGWTGRHTVCSAALKNSMTADLWDAVIPNFALHWDVMIW